MQDMELTLQRYLKVKTGGKVTPADLTKASGMTTQSLRNWLKSDTKKKGLDLMIDGIKYRELMQELADRAE